MESRTRLRQQIKAGFLRLLLAATFVASGAVANADADCAEPIGPEAALDAGVAAIHAAHLSSTYVNLEGGTFESVIYYGLADFLARNPGCCKFTPYGQDEFAPTPEWSERYSFYGFARATFKAYLVKDGDAKREVVLTKAVAVTTCGRTIWYDVDDDNW